MLAISNSCTAHFLKRRSPLLLHFPTPSDPITPSQVWWSVPTLALKSPRRMSLSVCFFFFFLLFFFFFFFFFSHGLSFILILASLRVSYIRHLSYCFYIAVNRICVAISRVDGALKPWSAIHLGVGNSKQKPTYLDLPVSVM